MMKACRFLPLTLRFYDIPLVVDFPLPFSSDIDIYAHGLHVKEIGLQDETSFQVKWRKAVFVNADEGGKFWFNDALSSSHSN